MPHFHSWSQLSTDNTLIPNEPESPKKPYPPFWSQSFIPHHSALFIGAAFAFLTHLHQCKPSFELWTLLQMGSSSVTLWSVLHWLFSMRCMGLIPLPDASIACFQHCAIDFLSICTPVWHEFSSLLLLAITRFLSTFGFRNSNFDHPKVTPKVF